LTDDDAHDALPPRLTPPAPRFTVSV